MHIVADSEDSMKDFGAKVGQLLRGGEVFELVGDIGAGKTTFTKGLARGLGVTDTVQSPTFTISRVYDARDSLEMRHYDFYRLDEAGIMADELADASSTEGVVTVVEWAGIVDSVLPDDRIRMVFKPTGENSRQIEIEALGERSSRFVEELNDNPA